MIKKTIYGSKLFFDPNFDMALPKRSNKWRRRGIVDKRIKLGAQFGPRSNVGML